MNSKKLKRSLSILSAMREDWNMDARVEHHFLHDILEVYFKALHPAAAPIHGFCNDPRNTV